MTRQEYLARLEMRLASLDAEARKDVLLEMGSHIDDLTEQFPAEDEESIVGRLDTPEAFACAILAELGGAECAGFSMPYRAAQSLNEAESKVGPESSPAGQVSEGVPDSATAEESQASQAFVSQSGPDRAAETTSDADPSAENTYGSGRPGGRDAGGRDGREDARRSDTGADRFASDIASFIESRLRTVLEKAMERGWSVRVSHGDSPDSEDHTEGRGERVLTWPFSRFERLRIAVGSADVELIRSSGDLRVELEGPRAESRLKMVEGGAELYLEQLPSSLLRSKEGTAKLERLLIAVPARILSIVLKSGSGDLTLREMDASLELHTGSGDVLAEGCSDAHVQTGSGSVSLHAMAGDVSVSTGSGDVELHGLLAAARVRTGSGSIEVKGCPASLDAETGSGDVRVVIEDDEDESFCDLRVRTASGDIECTLGPLHGARMLASSASGSVTLPQEDADEDEDGHHGRRRRSWSTRLGDGGHNLRFESGSGDIVIGMP